MSWLVTGAAGFAGRHLVAHLEALGERVVGVGHDAPVDLDLRDAEALDRAVAAVRPTHVVHLGGTASREAMARDPTGGNENITLPVVHLLDALLRHAPKAPVLVVVPSDVYGRGDGSPLAETAPLRPTDLFGAAWASATYLTRRHLAAGLPVVVARVFPHLGPEDDRTVVATWRREHAAGGPVRVPDPDAVRDWSDVRDVVAAYALLARAAPGGTVWNVGSGEGRRTADVVHAILPAAEVVAAPELTRRGDAPARVADVEKLRGLGWAPRFPWAETTAAAARAPD